MSIIKRHNRVIEIHSYDCHGAVSVGRSERRGRQAWETTVGVAWVGARGKVSLCPSIVGIFVLSATGRAGQASGEHNATTSQRSGTAVGVG